MKVENPDEYVLVRFQKSTSKGKKYDAILKNKKTNREKKIPFGALGYEQFKDNTGLGLYSHLNHGDSKRRDLYRQRHAGEENAKFSSGYFAWKYLW